MDEQIFTQNYQIKFYDVDTKYHLKPDTILAWAGELAGDHLRSRNIPRERLWQDGQVFLLTRCVMKYNKVPKYRENISINTWEFGTKGVQFNRLYDITDESGNVLIEAHSLWVLVNPQTHKLLRPTEYAHKMYKTEREISVKVNKIKFEEGNFAGKYNFIYTDIDANGHVNNGAYVRLAQSFSPFNMNENAISKLDISFIKEAMQGDEIHLFTTIINENTYQIYGEFPDKTKSFQAEIETTPVK